MMEKRRSNVRETVLMRFEVDVGEWRDSSVNKWGSEQDVQFSLATQLWRASCFLSFLWADDK